MNYLSWLFHIVIRIHLYFTRRIFILYMISSLWIPCIWLWRCFTLSNFIWPHSFRISLWLAWKYVKGCTIWWAFQVVLGNLNFRKSQASRILKEMLILNVTSKNHKILHKISEWTFVYVWLRIQSIVCENMIVITSR